MELIYLRFTNCGSSKTSQKRNLLETTVPEGHGGGPDFMQKRGAIFIRGHQDVQMAMHLPVCRKIEGQMSMKDIQMLT